MIKFFLIFAAFLFNSSVIAGVVKVDFSFSNLQSPNAPTIPSLKGDFTYEAAALDAAPKSLLSIDLSFGNHVYSIDELMLAKPGPFMDSPIYSLFGINNYTIIDGGTNDFYFDFDPSQQKFLGFAIGGIDTIGFYGKTFLDSGIIFNMSFTEDANAIPEPNSFALFSLGMAALLIKRKKS